MQLQISACLLLAMFATNIAFANRSTDTVIARYKQVLLKDVSIKQLDDFTAKQGFNLTANNTWADINYADTSPSYWQVRDHLGRVKALAMAWSMPQSHYYHQPAVWQTFSKGLNHWLQHRYQNSNWWVNEIGVPQDMRDILVLVSNELSHDQFKQALEVLGQHKVRGVGANLIWSSDLAIFYGAFAHNDSMINRAVQLINNEIKITTADGIQPDYSFHQHDARLQIYHYGLSFLETTVRIAWEVRGTDFSFPQEKINILTDFILNGWQWMSRGINIVPGTIDRAASRKDQLHNADLRGIIQYLIAINPVAAKQFQSIAARQNGGGIPLIGFKYFPYSDFAAYQQKDFTFFVKTISTRTLKSESINTENLKGRLLDNGDGYLIKNGNEYFNLMPNWNWNFLPGETNSKSSTDTILSNNFSGSVSDGNSGITAMKYSLSEGINANKIWACHNNLVVCLISNLSTKNADSIFTALDQSRWQTAVTVNQPGNSFSSAGTYQLHDVRWLYQSNFAYILLRPATVQLHLGTRTSSWSEINKSASAEAVTDKVFMPLLYQSPADYPGTGYVLTACKSADEAMAIANNPAWKVITNNAVCQAVEFKDNVVMAAFYSSGSFRLNKNETLSVSKPCLIEVTKTTVFISDPLHTGGPLNCTINGRHYKVNTSSDGTTTSFKR